MAWTPGIAVEGEDMRIGTCEIRADRRSAIGDLTASPDTVWARFGNEVLVAASDTQWARATRARDAGAPEPHVTATDVDIDRLHLVVQHGRLFQQHQPEVKVLLDKGRFLVVDLEPGVAREVAVGHETCFGIQPLPRNAVVCETRQSRGWRAEPRDWIQNLVTAVEQSPYQGDLETLASRHTRLSTSDDFAELAQWAEELFTSFGFATRREFVSVNGSASRNVVADKSGRHPGPRDLIVVTAHLDSINLAGGEAASAPGADDNASGSAAVLTMARLLANHEAMHDMRFILFGGEEQGLFGSRQHVQALSATEQDRIRAVVNMDMIGSFNTATPEVLIEGHLISQQLIDALTLSAMTYTGLQIQTSLNPFASDHVPFIRAGIPAVLTIESADEANQNIHSARDTLSTINYDLALEIVRMNLAFVAEALGRAGATDAV
jgi:hypothetical protein